MKKLLTLIFVLSLVMSFSACAEETEIESEAFEEPKKGSRLNPYEFGETIELGTIYYFDEDFIDVTITLDEILDANTITELYPNDTTAPLHFMIKGSLKTGAANTDDDEVYVYLDADLITSDLDDYYCSFEDYSDGSLIYSLYSYWTYDVLFECTTKDSIDFDAAYLRLAYCDEPYEDEADGDDLFVWIKLP